MQKESVLDADKDSQWEERQVEAAAKAVEEEPKAEEAKGLSLRDALEVAFEANKEPKHEKTVTKETSVDVVPRDAGTETERTKPKYSPPAEWTKEEKEDFQSSSEKAQEAALRLHQRRQSKLEEIKAASKEYQEIKALADSMAPYLKAIGVKEPTEVALKKALAMWRELEEGDPKAAAAAYLQAKGIEVPKELLNTSLEKTTDEKNSPLIQRLSAVEKEIASQKQAEFGSVLNQAWQAFEQEKNAAGKPKYPDVDESESGLKLASNIGSLVGGQTDLSKQFIANCRARIPDLTYPRLIAEAYRWCGGKVDESSASRTQETQKHLARSSRAASSVPGRGAPVSRSGQEKKFSSYREAAQAALTDLKEAEGA